MPLACLVRYTYCNRPSREEACKVEGLASALFMPHFFKKSIFYLPSASWTRRATLWSGLLWFWCHLPFSCLLWSTESRVFYKNVLFFICWSVLDFFHKDDLFSVDLVQPRSCHASVHKCLFLARFWTLGSYMLFANCKNKIFQKWVSWWKHVWLWFYYKLEKSICTSKRRLNNC